MNPKIHPAALFSLAALAAVGCASTTAKNLDTKLATQEQTVKSRQELKGEADRMIENDKDLSYDQKKRLSILRSQLSAQIDDITNQSLKLRSVLVEEILSPNYSLDEVGMIKGRLKKLEDKRLSLMFDGIDQANSILGRKAAQHSQVMRALLENRSLRD